MTTTYTDSGAERLQASRRVFKRAKAVFNANSGVMDCIMRDLSEAGARLACAQAAQLPDRFQLVVVTEREMREVRVIWRSLEELRVEFVSPPRRASHLLL